MKKTIIIFLCAGIFAVIMNSCLESYLDKAPESGLSAEEVFTKYDNFLKYFNMIYTGYTNKNFQNLGGTYDFNITVAFPMFWSSKQTYSWEGLTPMCDQGYLAASSHYIKSGIFAENRIRAFSYFQCPILSSMFMIIRTSNTTLQNINKLTDATPEAKDDLIAQAYFARAFAHMELCRWWGGMPYITKVIGPEDQWDLFRLTSNETYRKVAADFDTAVIYFEKAGKMRRDPASPGQAGHLNDPDQFRPTGVAAKAFKARALLYAASPLNNVNGDADWQAAATANWEAIKIAEQYGYDLLSTADYKKNFVGVPYTNEQLWGWNAGRVAVSAFGSLVPGIFTNAKSNSGQAPTQNTIDMFETRWGDPLNTPEEREAAAALGHYSEQNPYIDRDPRFYIDIIYNQAPLVGFGKADIYYEMVNGNAVYGYHLDQTYSGITNTGYYDRKHWGDQSVRNNVTTQYTDPLIRLAELYLNYAEAANEAYGPNTAAPGADMTAVQAANKVRSRINQPAFQARFTTGKDVFRPRLKNERTIELVFEGHYYHDLRRWMDAPAAYSSPLMGVDIEKVPVSASYPSGFRYTRRPIPAVRQTSWKDAMYYIPFMTEDIYKMKNFRPNPSW